MDCAACGHPAAVHGQRWLGVRCWWVDGDTRRPCSCRCYQVPAVGLLALLGLLSLGCTTGARADFWLSDPEAVGLIEALCTAEQLEAAPASAAAYAPAVEALALELVRDQVQALDELQALDIMPASSAASIAATLDGRAEQTLMAGLQGRALDDHFLQRESAAHSARLQLIRDQALTRCTAAGLCERERAYIAVEAQHLQRIYHP